MLNLKRIIYFYELKIAGSFTKAANRLNISQPHLSQEINKLEIDLGKPLIKRTTRSFAVTEFGEAFFKKIENLVNEHSEIEKFITGYKSSNECSLTVGVIPIFNRFKYYEIFSLFKCQHPEINTSFIDGFSSQLFEKIKKMEIHLAFLTPIDEYFQDPGIEIIELFEEEISLIMSDTHPLAQAESLTLRGLISEQLIVPQRGTGEFQAVTKAFTEINTAPTSLFECSNMEIIIDLVKSQSCIVFLTRSVVEKLDMNGLVNVRLDNNLKRKVAVSFLKNQSRNPFIKLFISFLHQYNKDNLPLAATALKNS